MMIKTRHRLRRTLEKSVAITRLYAEEAPRPFNAKYGRPPKPPAIDGKMPDLQGVDSRGAIHSGGAETSASGRETEDQLRVFVRRPASKISVPETLRVFISFGRAESEKNTIRRTWLEDKPSDR